MKKGAISGTRKGAQVQLTTRKGIIAAEKKLDATVKAKYSKFFQCYPPEAKEQISLFIESMFAPQSDFEFGDIYSFLYDGISYIKTYHSNWIYTDDIDDINGRYYIKITLKTLEESCLGEYRKDSRIRRKFIDALRSAINKPKPVYLLTQTKESAKLSKRIPFEIIPSIETERRGGRDEKRGKTETHAHYTIYFPKFFVDGRSRLTFPEFLQAKLEKEALDNHKAFEFTVKGTQKTLSVDFVRKFIIEANLHDNKGTGQTDEIGIDGVTFAAEVQPRLIYDGKEEGKQYLRANEMEAGIKKAAEIYADLVNRGIFQGVNFNLKSAKLDEITNRITLSLDRKYDEKNTPNRGKIGRIYPSP